MASEFTDELTALFLLQRWSGMRINDCLMLPRTGLVGNNVRTVTEKTGAQVDCEIPDEAVAALLRLSPDRERFLPGYFFWQKSYAAESLTTQWDCWIRRLNLYLDLKDDKGQPMRFHSHMLRDTFAVELLMAGVALEDVSRMLTHASIKTTEDYYAHWVPDRLALLKEKARQAMRKMGAKLDGK
jgi:integrase